MKKLSVLFMGAVMALCLSVPSFAVVGTNQSNLDYAFNTHTLNASPVALSSQEMIETEGEFWFLVPAIISAVSYSAPAISAGSFSWGGLAWAAGSGLMGGGVYGSVGRAVAPAIGYGRFGFNALGSGIGYGLNYSNPW